MRRTILAAAATGLIGACSAEPGPETASGAAGTPAVPGSDAPATDAPETGAAETTGGDGSELVLTGLEPGEGADLAGELGCSFTAGGARLLTAMANVGANQPINALIKVGDYPQTLLATAPGGFDRLVDGTTFAGRGMTVEIAHDGQDLAEHEGSRFDATLTARRGDGAERSWDGSWTCGP